MHLDLPIDAPGDFHQTFGAEADAVSGPQYPHSRLERINLEWPVLKLSILPIAERQIATTHDQFARAVVATVVLYSEIHSRTGIADRQPHSVGLPIRWNEPLEYGWNFCGAERQQDVTGRRQDSATKPNILADRNIAAN